MKSVLISIQPYWVFLIIARLMGKYSRRDCNGILDCNNRVTHAPQSWGYVEQ